VLLPKKYGRLLVPGLAVFDPRLPAGLAKRSALATAWRALKRALEQFIDGRLTTA